MPLDGIDVRPGLRCRRCDCGKIRYVPLREICDSYIRARHAEHPSAGFDDNSTFDLVAANFSVLMEANPPPPGIHRYPLHVRHSLRPGFAVMFAHRGQCEARLP